MSDQVNLSQQVLLVSLHFSLCRQSKASKEQAKEVEDNNHAARGTTRVSYYYFQQQQGKQTIDALAEVKSHFNAWAAEHRRLTKPWDAGNTRLLPAALVGRYMEMTQQFETAAPGVLAGFFEVHNDWLVTAPTRMGALFSAADFPSLQECREKIGWEKSMIPLPQAEQWKQVELVAPGLATAMEATTNERITRAVEEARQQTWSDLFKPVQNIVEVLTKDKPRIFESLLGNLTNILDLAPSFNLTSDTEMTRFIQEAREGLSGVTAEELRKDPDLRIQTVNTAKALLTRFGEMGVRKFA